MAIITGKVQLFENADSKVHEIGQPFARKKGDKWFTLEGKPLTVIIFKKGELLKKDKK